MRRQLVDIPWRLAYRDTLSNDVALERLPSVPATVPGNVELDLSRAGILPTDLFRGDNILATRDVESYEWWYSAIVVLTAEEVDADLDIVFHGVDGDAEYFFNGQAVGTSSNSLIEHVVSVGAAARPGDNELIVHIRPPHLPAEARELVPLWTVGEPLREASVWTRKAPHVYGWDIMPRALSAGIWRPIELVAHDPIEIAALYAVTTAATQAEASLRVFYELRGELDPSAVYQVAVTGRCGESTFRLEQRPLGPVGAITGTVGAPRLWWPRDYGHPDLYQLTTELSKDGVVVATRSDKLGIRTVVLDRAPSTASRREFKVLVNGVPVYCRGTNWVPVDAFHSRDAAGLPQRLDLLWRSNCNTVRCWGGNVYEDEAFFDYCDERGILVWQDFALACTMYPQTEAFARGLVSEVRAVARRLRGHPSLVLWCGDNEGDQMDVLAGIRPDTNTITREVVAETVGQEDPYRPYLPSSPYISEEIDSVLRSRDLGDLPETHLWGPRDFYKSEFYVGATAAFVSEIGFMAIPAEDSLRRFIDEPNLWPVDNRQWLVHASDPTADFSSRFWRQARKTFIDCARYLFGSAPQDIHTAVMASQAFQAEGYKFAIELGRQRKWDRTGVIWWNILDGWPMASSAVVDYYLREKLAMASVSRSQRPLALIVGEGDHPKYDLMACNDTRRDLSGTFDVWDIEAGEQLRAGSYWSPANRTVTIGSIVVPSPQTALLLRWKDPDGHAVNHYLVGEPPFDLDTYLAWLEVVEEAGRQEAGVAPPTRRDAHQLAG